MNKKKMKTMEERIIIFIICFMLCRAFLHTFIISFDLYKLLNTRKSLMPGKYYV